LSEEETLKITKAMLDVDDLTQFTCEIEVRQNE
jgi:hypothetical protein